MVSMKVFDDMSTKSMFALVDDAGIPMGMVGVDVARDLVGSGRAKGVWRISAEAIEHAMKYRHKPRPHKPRQHTCRIITAGSLSKSRLRKFEPSLGRAMRSA